MGKTTSEIDDFSTPISDADNEHTNGDNNDDNNEKQSPEELRAHIEQTRSEMSETIQQLQERLDPQRLKEQAKEEISEQIDAAKDSVKEATIGKAETFLHNVGEKVSEVTSPIVKPLAEKVGEASHMAKNLANHSGERVRGGGQQMNASSSSSLVETIKQNPVPAAMAAFGIGWLLINNGKTSQTYSTTYNKTSNGKSFSSTGNANLTKPLSQAGDVISDKMSDAREKVSDVMESAHEKAEHLGEEAHHKAEQAQDTFQRTLQDSPLSIGIIALALGAAAGLCLPSTAPEQKLMGDAHEQVIGKASDLAHDTLNKVQNVAGKVVEEAKNTIVSEAQEQGLTS